MESNSEKSSSDTASTDSPLRKVHGSRAKRRARGGGRGARGVRAGGRGTRGHRLGRGERQPPLVQAEIKDQRKTRVKELIENMSEPEVKDFLCQVVDKQPGLIFDILDRVEPDQPEGYYSEPGQAQAPGWCSCSRCREMPTVAERICFGQRAENCISQLLEMERYILDQGVLALARLYRREVLVFPEERDMTKANRHAAYRQFTMWRHGRLGAGVPARLA